MNVLDLTVCPAGQFAGYLLAELGHRVFRAASEESPLSSLAYGVRKVSVGPEQLAAQIQELDVVLIDDWQDGRGWLASRGLWNTVERGCTVVHIHDGAGAQRKVTGFVLDHGLGFSDELPAGNPYRFNYAGPSMALPGCVTDHDAGVQAAIAALAWCGLPCVIDFSVLQAAVVSHRYSADIADLEPETFQLRNPKAGIPFGGVLKCLDGYVEVVVFTAGAWRAVAAWLGDPSWTRHPDFPSKAYVDAHAERYQGEILAWAETKATAEVLALADRDGVPAAEFVSIAAATADTYRVREGYSEQSSGAEGYLPSLPFWPRPKESTPSSAPNSGRTIARPLDGVVVVDFTVAQAGAHAAWVLAQLGATVVKIEHRDKPDIARLWTPGNLDTSFAFVEPNAGKQSVLLRWDAPAGRDVLTKLISRSDVFLTNVRPSILSRIHLTSEDIAQGNPRILYATISSDGSADPIRANRPGWAMTFGAASGLGAAVTGEGEPPAEVSGWADYAVGNQAALAIVQALRSLGSTDTSAVDTNATAALSLLMRDTAIERQALAESRAERRIIRCADGIVAYDATYSNNGLAEPLPDKCSDLVARLRRLDIPAAQQISMEDLYRGKNAFDVDVFWVLDEHVVLGRGRRTVKPPWSIGGIPVGSRQDAPWLGEHTRSVAENLLGMSEDEVLAAEATGILG